MQGILATYVPKGADVIEHPAGLHCNKSREAEVTDGHPAGLYCNISSESRGN